MFPLTQAKSTSHHRTRDYVFFGKTYKTRNTFCLQNELSYEEMPEKIRLPLTICPVSYCDASCRFCIAKNTAKREKIDLKKLEYALEMLKREDAVSKIYLKGGEPFHDIELLNNVLDMIFDMFGNELYVSISTNGNNLKNIHKITTLKHINKIHISRHHYDDAINNSIFGKQMISSDDIKQIAASIPDEKTLVYNCMLLKDFINTTGEAHKFLDFAIATKVNKVAFMSCAPVNEYAKQQFIHFSEIFKEDDSDILYTNKFCDYEFCSCISGVYLSPDAICEPFYARYTNTEGCDYLRGFVYESDNILRTDYSGEIITFL